MQQCIAPNVLARQVAVFVDLWLQVRTVGCGSCYKVAFSSFSSDTRLFETVVCCAVMSHRIMPTNSTRTH